MLLLMALPHKLRYRVKFFLYQVILETRDDPGERPGLPERRGADLNGARPGKQELDDVLGRSDPPDPDDRDLHFLVALPHHAQGYGLDRRTGQPAAQIPQKRLSRLHVYRHSLERVDQAQGVGPTLLGGPGYLYDARHVRRELRDNRQLGSSTGGGDHLRAQLRRLGDDGSMIQVRAGEVQLQRVDPGLLAQPG